MGKCEASMADGLGARWVQEVVVVVVVVLLLCLTLRVAFLGLEVV